MSIFMQIKKNIIPPLYTINDIISDIYEKEGFYIQFINYHELEKIQFNKLYSEVWVEPVNEIASDEEQIVNEIILRIEVFIRDTNKVTIH